MAVQGEVALESGDGSAGMVAVTAAACDQIKGIHCVLFHEIVGAEKGHAPAAPVQMRRRQSTTRAGLASGMPVAASRLPGERLRHADSALAVPWIVFSSLSACLAKSGGCGRVGIGCRWFPAVMQHWVPQQRGCAGCAQPLARRNTHRTFAMLLSASNRRVRVCRRPKRGVLAFPQQRFSEQKPGVRNDACKKRPHYVSIIKG